MLGRTLSWRVIAGALGALAVASLAWALARDASPAVPAPVLRAELDILTRTDSGVLVSGLDISPDGSMIVYAAKAPEAKAFQLFLRRLDDRLARPIPGTEGAREPVFSPNGASIAYIHDAKAIRRIPVSGGTVETVLQGSEQSNFFVLRWGDDDFIYYDDDGTEGIYRVSAKGATPQVVVKGGSPEYPEPLPGGRTVLYSGEIDNEIRVMDIETGKSQSLGLKAMRVRYLSDGYLLLLGMDALQVVPFDARTLAVKGARMVRTASSACRRPFPPTGGACCCNATRVLQGNSTQTS